MNTKFLKYNWEKLIEEDSFISWVTRNQNQKEWDKFIAKHPEFKKVSDKAREIIFVLQDEYEDLDKSSIQKLWRNIVLLDEQYRKKAGMLKISKALAWAATVLLVITISSVTIFYLQKRDKRYEFLTGYDTETQHAYVLLPAGEKISITNKYSKIIVNSSKEQLIINDSIITLANTQHGKKNIQMNEVVIPFGKKMELVLDDGTLIWLNAGSRIAFPLVFSEDTRVIHLEGEACFQVAESDIQPFIVKTGDIDIRVHGTFFNVSAYPEQETIETVLINGSVSLVKPGLLASKSMEIHPNQKADFNKTENKFTVTNEPNAEKYVSWVQDWLEYRRESLNSVLTRLERFYDVTFHLPPGFPADDKISGKLNLRESLEYVMMVLSDAAEIKYSIKGKEVYIQRKANS
jgi:transmembrane sensor